MEKVLGNGDFRLLQVEFNLILIYFFHPRKIHVFSHQSQHGGAHVLVHPLVEREDHVIGCKRIPVVPLDTLSEIQGPGLQIITYHPVFQQIGMGDVFAIGKGEVFGDLASYI